MAGWSVQVATVDGVYTDYGNPTDLEFVERLNGLGYWSAYLPGLEGLAEPVRDQVARIWWDKGGGDETLHFEGVIRDVRRQTAIDAVRLRGLDILGLLWQTVSGGVRDYEAKTPFAIAQTAGTPNPLLTNAQAAAVMTYGSAAAVPNKVDAVNPGVAMTFRSDSHRLLSNFQRLALQSQYNNTDVPATLRWGLEFFAQLEGANGSSPRFYLVRRRERAAVYTPESFNIPLDFVTARRGVEGMAAAHAIRAIGTGTGLQRVESTLHGTGSTESIISDKTMLGLANAAANTNANVMAERLKELLDPATEIITGSSLRYVTPTRLGDLVNVTETGKATAQLRCFERGFSLAQRTLFYSLGRPRPHNESSLAHLVNVAEGAAQGPQMLGGGIAGAGTDAQTTLADGATRTFNVSFSSRNFRPKFDQGILVHVSLASTDTLGSPLAGTYDLTALLTPGVGGSPVSIYRERTQVGTTGPNLIMVYVPSVTFTGIGANTEQTGVRVEAVNRSGADRDVTIIVRADIQG